MDLPSHPDAGETDAPAPATTASWRTRIVVGLIGLVVALVIVLHLTGVVGPAGR